jgi:translation initiation factor 1
LPKELCACQEIALEQQRISIYSMKKKFGKIVTIVEGIDGKQFNIKDLVKQFKSKLACGGTTRGDTIELQGDQRTRVKDILVEMGFSLDKIDMR